MQNRHYFAVALAALYYSAACLAAESSPIPFEQLPEPVQKTVLEILDRPQISKISRISDNNLLRFEIEADKTENNQELMTWDIVVAASGKLMKLSKEVPYFALSYPQMQTIEARYPGIKVTETESVDLHFYNVIGEINGRPVKFKFYEDGFIEEQP
ncbi:hypothetical protein [Methylomonas koyamae]|uniref:Uncharacterized protein n=1 Tax=Methylomonas koyamae TaxID=702114 RepID=A0A291ILF8_9GAMM|nr:hypothetical protein [Methylomonas koyamae]ATG91046.1 hypothetical protein MKLM6_2840 [Methylomonas koyamae]OAI23084.1 hypothetical protein A1356_18285 [Methylomonas koyamae]